MSITQINFGEYTFCLNRIAYWLISNNKTFKTRDVYGYQNVASTKKDLITVIKNRGKNVKLDNSAFIINEFVECAIFDNKDLSFLPNYVTCSDGKTKLYLDTYVDMANRVSAYEVLNGRSPNIVYIKKENKTSTSTPTLDYFESKFGKCEYIDDAMSKIKGRGYAYYYNSQYNTNTTINRIYNRQGVNCTDSAQLFYRLALDMNNKYGRKYEVQFVHVFCQSGTGHIRLRLRSNGSSWFYRDPSACLDGNNITYNWCSNGRVNAYNPAWIFADLYV